MSVFYTEVYTVLVFYAEGYTAPVFSTETLMTTHNSGDAYQPETAEALANPRLRRHSARRGLRGSQLPTPKENNKDPEDVGFCSASLGETQRRESSGTSVSALLGRHRRGRYQVQR